MDESAGNGDKAHSEAVNQPTGAPGEMVHSPAIDGDLPMVEAPKLGSGDAMVPSDAQAPAEASEHDVAQPCGDAAPVSETPNEPSSAAPAAPPRSSRFALLAATIAIAAALGSFMGSLTASGLNRAFPAKSVNVTATSATADVHGIGQAMKAQLAEITAIKANLDAATRNTSGQFAKIADRLDRLDKRSVAAVAAPEVTGSIGPSQPQNVEPKLPILEGWIVQDVQGGRALVASRNGGEFDVGTGSFLPGVGRIESIKRQDGQWIVITARGMITSVH